MQTLAEKTKTPASPLPSRHNDRTPVADSHWPRNLGNRALQHAKQNPDGIPERLRSSLEAHSGLDLSSVKVHRNSSAPARLDALAYTRGQDIHLGPGQEKHLPHEAWHVVQQMQGRVKSADNQINNTPINQNPSLEAEADRIGTKLARQSGTTPGRKLRRVKPAGDPTTQPVQRQVRIDGGRRRVNEARYQAGGSRESVGSRFRVSSLIADRVKRVFDNTTELENYANGRTDYIGDVATTSAGTFWYRLPPSQLTVLGESHSNANGNSEDVIMGLNTSRFMYEGLNEFVGVSPFNGSGVGTGTQTRLNQIASRERLGSQISASFDPALENIVIKALTGTAITRNEFIPGDPATMNARERSDWGARASTTGWSYGERVALYLSLAIHIAADISRHIFGPELIIESNYYNSGRRLSEFYTANQSVLDAFMNTKDGDDLIGIYEITAANSFADLPILERFTLVFHEFGSRYIEQLGVELGNTNLESEGNALSSNLSATLSTLSPAREEIMWAKVQHANTNNYLIVGMGDAHRTNLEPRLNAAGIRHAETEQSLQDQKRAIDSSWVP